MYWTSIFVFVNIIFVNLWFASNKYFLFLHPGGCLFMPNSSADEDGARVSHRD